MTSPSHTRRSDPDGGLRPRRECCDNNMATLFLSVFLDNNLNIRTLQFPSPSRSASFIIHVHPCSQSIASASQSNVSILQQNRRM